MARSQTLRLASLDGFARALLLALGVAPLAACASEVIEEGTGGSGGQGSSPATATGSSPATGSGAGSAVGTSVGTGNGGGAGTGASTVGTGAVGTGASSVVTSTGVGGGSGACENPTPLIIDGVDTGFDTCGGGNVRRREARECPVELPGGESCCGECEEGYFCSTSGEVGCSCVALCRTDADCGPGLLCMCGTPAGQCVSATCTNAGDCAEGQECTSWDTSRGCLYPGFDCTTPNDTCGGDLDCLEPGFLCTLQPDGSRTCVEGGCDIGRPFLVGAEVRTAPVTARADWRAGAVDVAVPAQLRDELAAAWEHIARMEHASVAAFARFSLQLLALGSPPDLLERTHRALADETRHARLAFGLASAYRGRDVGPGSLPIDDALTGASDVATFVRLTVREGCVGETVAALEAGEGAAVARNPAVASILAEIARDEAEHAELAWRSVRWALATFGEAAAEALRGELALLRAELARPEAGRATTHDEVLLQHGVISSRVRAGLRREALRRLVVPCLDALLRDRSSVSTGPSGAARSNGNV